MSILIPKQKVVVCKPTFFGVAGPDSLGNFANQNEAENHAIYQKDPAGFRVKAMEQWEALMEGISRYADLIELEPIEGQLDQCFTADVLCSVNVDGKTTHFLTGQFTNTKRQPETIVAQKKIAAIADPSEIVIVNTGFEGNGDLVPDTFRGQFYAGGRADVSPNNAAIARTDLRSHKTITTRTSLPVRAIENAGYAFHIDTAMGVLPRGEMLVCTKGMSKKSYEDLIQRDFLDYSLDPAENLIDVSLREAKQNFACNVRVLAANHVFMSKCSSAITDQIKARGYEVHEYDLSCFIMAGGGAHCLTSVLGEKIYADKKSPENVLTPL